MIVSQLVPFARSAGISTVAATYAISIGAIGNAGGRILSGWLSDTFGRLATLRSVILLSAIVTPLLFVFRQQPVLFYSPRAGSVLVLWDTTLGVCIDDG